MTADEAPDPDQFKTFDLDQDGKVSLQEVLKTLRPERTVQPSLPPSSNPVSAPDPAPSLTGIGRRIALPKTYRDLSGNEQVLKNRFGPNGLVLALTSSTCPVSRRYLPTIARLRPQLDSKGLGLLLVPAFESDSLDSLSKFVTEAGLQDVCTTNPEWINLLQAHSSCEVFLIDRAGTLLYRGALDDQYGPNHSRSEPTKHHLLTAITQFQAGEIPSPAAAYAPGCELSPKTPTPRAVTYHEDVARILQRHCGTCHTDGGIAPFALSSPEEVLERSRTIERVLSQHSMPPWFAAPSSTEHASPWKNDRSLPEQDRADLLQWLQGSEHPLGDPALAPASTKKKDGQWSIGTPDLVLQIPKPIQIPASGTIPYQHAVVIAPTNEDRWIQAYEIRPTAREVVHHVLVNVHPKGSKLRDLGEGYWAAYVPGNAHQIYPEGIARKLPAGARVTFQIHYAPNGSATQDQLQIGLRFSKTQPTREVETIPVAHHRILIPPGAPHHVETFTQTLPTDFTVSALMAHMHVRGKAFKYELQLPDGAWETLLDLPRYDFNWQLRYEWLEPRLLRKGSVLKLTAVFDNSHANRANPDPTQTVRWGPQTSDEMMIGYVEHLRPLPAIHSPQ